MAWRSLFTKRRLFSRASPALRFFLRLPVGIVQEPIDCGLDIKPRPALCQPSPRVLGGKPVVDQLCDRPVERIIQRRRLVILGIRRRILDGLSRLRLPRECWPFLPSDLIYWLGQVSQQIVVLVGSWRGRCAGLCTELVQPKWIVVVVAKGATTGYSRCVPGLRVGEVQRRGFRGGWFVRRRGWREVAGIVDLRTCIECCEQIFVVRIMTRLPLLRT